MITVFQTRDFLSHDKRINKYIGSFKSVESAEEKLGFYFFWSCCVATPF